jgi:peptidoglycan hydrolase FlgJ
MIVSHVGPAAASPGTPASGPTGAGREAASAFEAVLLRQAMETMLPKAGPSLFGGGFANETWRSMFAEKLAESLARRGGVGIAQAVATTLADAERAGSQRSIGNSQ